MREITARGYSISRMNDYQIRELHTSERVGGYVIPAGMVREKFGLPEVGDVPMSVCGQTEARCSAIYERERSAFRGRHTGCCFPLKDGSFPRGNEKCPDNPDVFIQHKWDTLIREQGIEFPVGQSTSVARKVFG